MEFPGRPSVRRKGRRARSGDTALDGSMRRAVAHTAPTARAAELHVPAGVSVDAVVMGDLNLLWPVARAGLRADLVSREVKAARFRCAVKTVRLADPEGDMERAAGELADLGRALGNRPVLYYESHAEWLCSYLRPKIYNGLSWRDPIPAIGGAAVWLRGALGRIAGRLVPPRWRGRPFGARETRGPGREDS